ncbi:MAG TPA: methyltransferase domain-containing protein [Blastocatellia bacterium]|jgi:SAM-dependent methyltransferase
MTDRAAQIFFEIHSGIPKEAPGDSAATKRAFSMIASLPPQPKILDIGCGPGRQTLDLASLIDCEIVAVDLHPSYLAALEEKAKQAGFSGCIRAMQMDMNALDFPPASFDLIWAEGSIYIAGFENGLKQWKRLLKEGGWMAVTEVSWLRSHPPEEIKQFWAEAYPAIRSLEENLKIIAGCGYEIVAHFALPPSAWWDGYYCPIEQKLVAMREKYKDDREALLIMEAEQLEIDIYRKYSDFYGYVFYVMRSV